MRYCDSRRRWPARAETGKPDPRVKPAGRAAAPATVRGEPDSNVPLPQGEKAGTGRDPRARRPAGVETARVPRAGCTGATGVNPQAGCRFSNDGEPAMRRLLWAPALAAIAAPALAEETTMTPETVVSATRIPTPVVDIPAGVTVIDRQTIEERGYTTLTQALAAVPGVHVSQSGGPGGNASVFIRGTNSNQVLVLRDGMPLNDASDASGAFNFGIDTLADVERIEVIRGPMAALYGSGAIGGVINLISRQGHEQGFHLTGELAGGYPRQMEGNANASGIEGPFDYSATIEGQRQRGYDTTPQRESIYTGVPDPYRNVVGTLNLGYTPIDGTRLSLFLRARNAQFGFNALGNPTFDDSNSTGYDDTLLGRVGVASKLFNGAYETSVFAGRL